MSAVPFNQARLRRPFRDFGPPAEEQRETPEIPLFGLRFWVATLVIFVSFAVSSHEFDIHARDDFAADQDTAAETASGGDQLRRFGFITLAVAGAALLLLKPQGRWAPSKEILIPGLGVALLAAASVFWSVEIGLTLRRLIVVAACALGAVAVARAFTLRQVIWFVFVVSLISTVMGLGIELARGALRPWDAEYRFAGTLHPNEQGLSLAALALTGYGLWAESNRRIGSAWLLVVCLAAVLLTVLTKSRTALASTLFCLGVLAWLLADRRSRWGIVALSAMAIMASLLGLLLVGVDWDKSVQETLLLGRGREAATLSGRLEIWDALWPYAMERPVLGYGWESFWTTRNVDLVADEIGFPVLMAHSSWLELALGIGVVGLGLAIWALLASLSVTAVRHSPACSRGKLAAGSGYAATFALLIWSALNAFSESNVVIPLTTPFLIGCLVLRVALYSDCPVKRREEAAESEEAETETDEDTDAEDSQSEPAPLRTPVFYPRRPRPRETAHAT